MKIFLTKLLQLRCSGIALLLQRTKILSANIKDLVRQSLILIHAYYKTSHIQACFLMPTIQVTIDKRHVYWMNVHYIVASLHFWTIQVGGTLILFRTSSPHTYHVHT